MKEVWKKIPDFPDHSVSNLGNVKRTERYGDKSDNFHVGRLKRKIKGGYKNLYDRVKITISHGKNGKTLDQYVHYLVLTAFVGPRPSDNHQASHINGNHSDNRLENLQWETIAENNKRKILHGTSGKGSLNSRAVLNEKKVESIIKQYLGGKTSEFLSEKYKVSVGCIRFILARKTWKHVSVDIETEKNLKLERKNRMLATLKYKNKAVVTNV